VQLSVPSGATNVALMTPHVRALPVAVSVVERQRSMAFAACVASELSSVTVDCMSQPLGSSSGVPSQSSSTPFMGTSKAPGLMLGSQSLQSPSVKEKPSPS